MSMQGELDHVTVSYTELSRKYETDVLIVREQMENIQQELNLPEQDPAPTMMKDLQKTSSSPPSFLWPCQRRHFMTYKESLKRKENWHALQSSVLRIKFCKAEKDAI